MHTIRGVRTIVATLLLVGAAAPAAQAGSRPHVLAQQGEDLTGTDDEGAGQEQQSGRGAGQDRPAAETGAGQGETEGASDEAGPPWTYQMARITVVLLVVLALGIGAMYYRLVTSRRRAGI